MNEKVSLGRGKPSPPSLPDLEDYVVDFDGADDPSHPYNWKLFTKLFTSILVCAGTLIVSFTSAVFAAGINQASKEFSVSSEVGKLGTTLYVLGFALGPVVWAPASELRGRKWPLTIALLGGGIFTIGSAVAKDIQTLLICRFFAGICGASQLTVVPGVLADVFDNTRRGVAISLYALTVFVGPFSAPFIGGFIASSYLGWRWTLYIPAILSLATGAISVLFLSETYAPCLLMNKAAELRRRTQIWGIHAKQERMEVEIRVMVNKYFTRPLKMLFTEPIILLVSLYMSFIYGLVYALLEAYPYVFENIYGMSPGIGGLPFIGLIVGQVLAVTLILLEHTNYAKKLVANKGVPVPEWRLIPPLIGAPVFTIGIFWFGWTGYNPQIHWAVPTAAGIFIGFGVLCVFLPCFNYLVDAYLPLAASTVAANIILRSTVAAGFPVFTTQMFENMGVQWACTLLGCLAAIMIPIPVAFRAYGPWLRSKSKLFK
ncbi:hypothetical protein N7532_010596 [Penicillium argentinense]|uniref:Major facilitator superfamily (MFS) profile domain-containing protein n=1 Tax=Penicillium argentinense TaxID=1131581 RepID=A0A9W9EQ46_9EURO|nr:uncharacterized protein N7532_010596 [Penicillium argentinense]KAJ5085825.1 hypothetical protein N7532_010596 [Penicillium argentinense]